MRSKKLEGNPMAGHTTRILSKFIEGRMFSVAVCSGSEEERIWTAHRLRNARKYLREFSLDEPKKVIDIVPANL